jgi:adenine-specific DNA-methyltransferase
MELFATDLERIGFLLEAEAELRLAASGDLVSGPLEESASSADGADQAQDTSDQTTELAADAASGEGAGAQEELPPEKRPKYITNYIGSKQKLVDWIWRNTPQDVKSAVDVFSGSAVVAYMFKTKGLRVTANDRLHYCHHAARAIIENRATRISDADLEMLLGDNPKAGSFVQDNFKGIFFAKGVHGLIDVMRANCDRFEGFKKDIALFALGKTCMSGKGGFGHFSSSTGYGRRQDTPEEFKERFADNVRRINALVFDNGQECKAHREDVNVLLPKVKADLAYFDPPYATEFSTTNYERSYHFVEGLMTYWKGLTLKADTKVKYYETDHETVTKSNATAFFQTFLASAKHIPHWLISYRDHAYPNEQEMKKIIGGLGRDSRMQSKDHHYSITSRHGDASHAKERLFVCRRSAGAKSGETPRPAPLSAATNFHTTIPVEVLLDGEDALSAEAMRTGPDGDPQFTFVLCRTGTNKNGDHFTAEELSGRYMTAVNKKIDLQHSQDFADIVGGIVGADYLEGENGGRIECVGELYVQESEHARLAHKLMRKGIIAQVSMECDYAEGECSICGKRVKSKNDYCPHLRKMKGGESGGKPVYEILHGVTFTGLGLLDRKGADENARILQVASQQQGNDPSKGDSDMDDKTKKSDDKASGAAKEKPAGDAPDNGGGDDSQKRIAELEKENKALKAQVAELQKRIEELEAERQAAANKSRARNLLAKLEKQGVDFGGDDEREMELKRLTELSDEAFAATEAAFSRMVRKAKAEAEAKEEKADKPEKKEEAKAETDPPMRSDAGVRPRDVDDRKTSLEDKLRDGFMAAYESRVGAAANE